MQPLSLSVVLQIKLNFHSDSSSDKELLAGATLRRGGTGEQWHQTDQRSRHPRGVPLRDHVRGVEFNHAGHPHGRAGDHRGGGQPVHGSCAGRKVNMQHKTNKKKSHYIPCLHIRTLYRFAYEHITPVKREKLSPKTVRVAPEAIWERTCNVCAQGVHFL